MGVLYLAALLFTIGCMVLVDYRYRTFFFVDPIRAAIVLVCGVAFFSVWDLAGIRSGIFFRGETEFMTGLQVAHEFPVEELFFLTLLCYLTMNIYGFVAGRRWMRATAGEQS